MAFSCSDFVSHVVNHLNAAGLLTAAVAHDDDLETQAAAVIEAIDTSIVQSTTKTRGVAARFMSELLDAHETLTEIGEHLGIRTLADCMYMLSALGKGTCIELHHPTESQILYVLRQLPSADEWMRHLHEVTE